MKKLPIAFMGTRDQKGYFFELFLRNETHAIYRKTKHKSPSWEVIEIQKVPDKTICEKFVEAHEKFPSPEQWGEAGWACMTLEDAIEKFTELTGCRLPPSGVTFPRIFPTGEGQDSGHEIQNGESAEFNGKTS